MRAATRARLENSKIWTPFFRDYRRRYLQSVWIGRTAGIIAEAQTRLEEERRAPEAWKKDVRDYIEALRRQALDSQAIVPADLKGDGPERLSLLQDLVRRFGLLLVYWPDLFRAALDLRQQGRTLA